MEPGLSSPVRGDRPTHSGRADCSIATRGFRRLFLEGGLEVKDSHAIGAKMNLQMLLDLVVKLRWQPHPTSLAGTALGFGNGNTGATAEEHLVAGEQGRVDILGHQVAVNVLFADGDLEVFDLSRGLL